MSDAPIAGPYVFVSYASVNRSRVIEIVDMLEAQGVATWFDRSDIPGGTSYGPEIVSGIKNAAAIILMCSEASLASRNVRQEIQLSWRHERPILPLLLEPLIFPDDVSYWLEGAQWIEVLDQPAETWLEQIRYALALMGYGNLKEGPPGLVVETAPLIQLPPNNLPGTSGPVIGRDRELKQIRSLLDHSRMITLTGPGGTGKTRLAEEAARESAARFKDGIWFVDAANARDAPAFTNAIATALAVREIPGEALLDSVASYLQNRNALLILDNLEQISDAVPVIAHLLAIDGPSIIATSRAPIRMSGEMVLPVAPLETLDPQPDVPASVIGRNPAVQLFVSRAKQVKPDFQLSDGNAFEVASICARLDGLPLAIELAAARSRLLHPAALLARLDSRLSVLTRGTGRSARQQTLHSTISWSYELLSPQEQAVFRRMGVFAGGGALEDVERVAAALPLSADSGELLDAVDALLDHSLIQLDQRPSNQETQRLRMLETIRKFALEILDQQGESVETRAAHASAYIDLASSAGEDLQGGLQTNAIERLETDHDNIRAAMDWLLSDNLKPGAPDALRLGSAMWRFWWMRGYLSEGDRRLDAAIHQSANLEVESLAAAFNGAGVLAEALGKLDKAERMHRSAIDAANRTGDQRELARGFDNLGIVFTIRGQFPEAKTELNKAFELFEQIGDERGRAAVLTHLVSVTSQLGDLEAAQDYSSEALRLWRKLGDQQSIGHIEQHRGIIELLKGDYAAAAAHYEAAAAIAEGVGDQAALANCLINLGSAVELQGKIADARPLLQRALSIFTEIRDQGGQGYALYLLGMFDRIDGNYAGAIRQLERSEQLLLSVGDQASLALCYETLAGVHFDQGSTTLAAAYLGRAQLLREATGVNVPAPRATQTERDRDAVAAALGPKEFAEATRTGNAAIYGT